MLSQKSNLIKSPTKDSNTYLEIEEKEVEEKEVEEIEEKGEEKEVKEKEEIEEESIYVFQNDSLDQLLGPDFYICQNPGLENSIIKITNIGKENEETEIYCQYIGKGNLDENTHFTSKMIKTQFIDYIVVDSDVRGLTKKQKQALNTSNKQALQAIEKLDMTISTMFDLIMHMNSLQYEKEFQSIIEAKDKSKILGENRYKIIGSDLIPTVVIVKNNYDEIIIYIKSTKLLPEEREYLDFRSDNDSNNSLVARVFVFLISEHPLRDGFNYWIKYIQKVDKKFTEEKMRKINDISNEWSTTCDIFKLNDLTKDGMKCNVYALNESYYEGESDE